MPKHEDFRATRDAEIKRIADGAERRGLPRDKAVQWAEQRVHNAMHNVVKRREDEGTSRVTEIRSE